MSRRAIGAVSAVTALLSAGCGGATVVSHAVAQVSPTSTTIAASDLAAGIANLGDALAQDNAVLAQFPGQTGSTVAPTIDVSRAQALALIDRRVTQLNALTATLASFGGTGTAAVVARQVAADASSLTALRGRIAADTDPTQLRQDVRTIGSVPVDAVDVPRVNLLGAAVKVQGLVAQFHQQQANAQMRIADDQAHNRPIGNAPALANDLAAKVADAAARAQTVLDQVSQAAGATITALSGALSAAHDDLVAASADLANIGAAL